MKNTVYFFLFIFFCTNGVAQPNKNIVPKKPVLIVIITVDNMGTDNLLRYWNNFSDKGFKRLASEGAYFPYACYPFLQYQHSQAYASLSTGTTPAGHGIIADKWYDNVKDKMFGAVVDDQVKPIGINRYAASGSHSPVNLLPATFSDELKMRSFNKAKVIGVGMEPEAAILPTGHIVDAAYWFDDETANWISSTFYMDSLPAWVREFNKKTLEDTYLDGEWVPYIDLKNYRGSFMDNNSMETGFGGQITFPYNLRNLKSKFKYRLLKSIPWGNTYTLDFAIAAIINEKLGEDTITDYLSINLSASKNINKLFGQYSMEMEDLYVRLDMDVAHLLEMLDDRFIKSNVLVLLTSSGMYARQPTYLEKQRIPAGYFRPAQAMHLAKLFLKASYGESELIKHYYNRNIYFDRKLLDEKKIDLFQLQNKTASFLLQMTGIMYALPGHTLTNNSFSEGIIAQLQRAYNPSRSGDIVLILEPGWAEMNYIESIETATGNVPLFFYGWKTKNAYFNTEIVYITDIAGTLAHMLFITKPPLASSGIIPAFTGK